jgi:hypothetical protein
MSDPAAVRFFGAVARYSPAESSTAD